MYALEHYLFLTVFQASSLPLSFNNYLFLTVFQSAHHPYCCFITHGKGNLGMDEDNEIKVKVSKVQARTKKGGQEWRALFHVVRVCPIWMKSRPLPNLKQTTR